MFTSIVYHSKAFHVIGLSCHLSLFFLHRIQYYLENLCYSLSKNIVMEEEPLQTSDEGLTRPLVLIKRCLDCIKELKFHAV